MKEKGGKHTHQKNGERTEAEQIIWKRLQRLSQGMAVPAGLLSLNENNGLAKSLQLLFPVICRYLPEKLQTYLLAQN